MGEDKYPTNWTEIRKIVLERDNYTCKHCGCKDNELRTSATNNVFKASLQVAHLDHDPENWEVSFDRLISLCQQCHLKNDRENSAELARIALENKRISKEKSGKPQMKTIIRELDKKIKKLENEIFARDLKIETLKKAIEDSSKKFNYIVSHENNNSAVEILNRRAERRKGKK